MKFLAIPLCLFSFAAMAQNNPLGPNGQGAQSGAFAAIAQKSSAAGMTGYFNAPYKCPAPSNDYTQGIFPGMTWLCQGQQFVNISAGLGQAIWARLQNLPLPADVLGSFVTQASVSAGGSSYAASDVIVLEGGVTLTVQSVAAGVITSPSGCAGWISGTTLNVTTACTSGTLAAGELLTASGIAAPAFGLPFGTYIVSGSGSTWTVNLSQTVGSSGSPVSFTASAVALTQPKMKGYCPSSLTGVTQQTTTGSGTGATFNLSMLFQHVYADRRVSACYTGNLYQITSSLTPLLTQNVGYLSDNSADLSTALFSGTGGNDIGMYGNYNSGSYPGVTTVYDQGAWNAGAGAVNATQTIAGGAPVLYPSRTIGKDVPFMFNSQGGTTPGGSLSYPGATSLSLSGLSGNTSNISLFSLAGTLGSDTAGLISLTASGATGTSYMGLASASPGMTCFNVPNSGSGHSGVGVFPGSTETPSFYGCVYNNGGLTIAHNTYLPVPYVTATISGYSVGSTQTVTVTAGSNGSSCPLTSTTSYSYTSTTGQTYQQTIAAMIVGFNAIQAFQNAGIFASINFQQAYSINFYAPQGSSCTFSFSSSGNGFSAQSSFSNGNGFAFSGGYIGTNTSAGNSTGLNWQSFTDIVGWPVTSQEVTLLNESVNRWWAIDGHPGLIFFSPGASNLAGYLTPFLQDVLADLPSVMNRSDMVIINPSGAGNTVANIASNWSNTYYGGVTSFIKNGNSNNQILFIFGEYNSLSTTGSHTAEYSSIQTLGGYGQAAGYTTVCSPEIAKNVTTTQQSENQALYAELVSSPGTCQYLINPFQYNDLNNQSGPWAFPQFTPQSTSAHVSALMNYQMQQLIGATISQFVQ